MSAACLDRARLGKQRVETLQILKAILDPNYGWQNHPAVKMWRDYPVALTVYGYRVCEAWESLGYADSCRDTLERLKISGPLIMPKWLGDRNFHASHRSNLLRKNPEYYSRMGWSEPMTLPYIWPA